MNAPTLENLATDRKLDRRARAAIRWVLFLASIAGGNEAIRSALPELRRAALDSRANGDDGARVERIAWRAVRKARR